MSEISEKEIEAARAVLERRIYDEGGCEAEQVPAMVREMLEAAARVRAEDNAAGGEVLWCETCGERDALAAENERLRAENERLRQTLQAEIEKAVQKWGDLRNDDATRRGVAFAADILRAALKEASDERA